MAVLLVLALMNFLNYVDRQVLGPLVVLLQRPISDGGLALTSLQGGLLATAFMLVHAVASVPLGVVADRFSRTRIISIGVGLWSLATAAAALSKNFGQMFLARATVGIGEATYAPAASALISERFSSSARARALGVFQLGMVLGGAIGVIIGGTVGGRYGWRAAFLVVGLPGLLLATLVLFIREARVVSAGTARWVQNSKSVTLSDTRALLRPALVWINVAGALVTFFTGALIFWTPKFILEYHYGGDTHMLQHATLSFGIIATLASIAGTLAGSFTADRIEQRRPGEGRLLAVAIGSFCTVPFAIGGFFAQAPLPLYTLLSIGVFFSVWYVGPILAALHDVVPPNSRGTATGVYFLVIHLLGDAISPPIVGYIGDRTGSMRTGLIVATVVLAFAGIAALMAIPESRRIAAQKRQIQDPTAAAR